MGTTPDWRAVLGDAADRTVAALERLAADEWAEHAGYGADGSSTARVDKVAEAAALEYLADAIPGVTLVSEEAGLLRGTGDLMAVVDPVDGTKNALRGIPYWAFSVAVFRGGSPVAALVRNVPAGIDYTALPEAPPSTHLHAATAGVRASPSTVTELARAAVSLQRPAYRDALPAATAILTRVPTVRILGAAALDLCLVGTGGVDCYVNPNVDDALPFGERVVDYAAAAVFVSAAGGVATDAWGEALTFPPDPAHRTSVVAAGNAALHTELLDVLTAAPPTKSHTTAEDTTA